jgi:hypothetical protein
MVLFGENDVRTHERALERLTRASGWQSD